MLATWHQTRCLRRVAEEERVHSGPEQYRARLVPHDPEKPDALGVAWLRRVFTGSKRHTQRPKQRPGSKRKEACLNKKIPCSLDLSVDVALLVWT